MMQEIDEKDMLILEVLKDHADFTTRQIAKKTLLPITTVHNRIRKLRKNGIIKKYTIELDNEKIGKNFMAYVLISVNLLLLKQKHKTQHDLVNELKKFYFVERADIVTGGTDIVVVIRVKDVKEFDNCLLNKLQLVEGIDRTQTFMVIYSRA
ncbi:MAG: AsnC family transcriptional regulator [Candidatus Woesearchaeota archaeon]|nr:MAG: AsnC family transcriptional regulator [Candidatus Woesearchaeota archaeon]